MLISGMLPLFQRFLEPALGMPSEPLEHSFEQPPYHLILILDSVFETAKDHLVLVSR